MNKEKLKKIRELLIEEYPLVATPLKHESSFQLLTATILSAQTLDETVNKVTPNLFSKFPTAEALSQANIDEVDKIIKIVNYRKTKSKNVILMATQIVENFGGITPYKMDELITLAGVGRKTANVLISEWFSKPLDRRGNKFGVNNPAPHYSMEVFVNPRDFRSGDMEFTNPQGFVVDTHVKRVSIRLGLTTHSDPIKVERDLMNIFPIVEWPEMSLRLIFHGRYRCKARKCECSKDPKWRKLCSGV